MADEDQNQEPSILADEQAPPSVEPAPEPEDLAPAVAAPPVAPPAPEDAPASLIPPSVEQETAFDKAWVRREVELAITGHSVETRMIVNK